MLAEARGAFYTTPALDRERPIGEAMRQSLLHAIVLFAFAATPAVAAAPAPEFVDVITVNGAITPITEQQIANQIDRSDKAGARALVLEIDTPGGLESSMRDMVKAMLAAEVPVLVTWTTPGGARAASAGVFVVMAGDVAAMAPGTNIGAATPVNMQGGDGLHAVAQGDERRRGVRAHRGRAARPQRGVGGARGARGGRRRARPRRSSSTSWTSWRRTLPELLAKADGRTWRRGASTRTLDVRGLPDGPHRARLPAARCSRVLADPNVAYILLMLGFYGLSVRAAEPRRRSCPASSAGSA